MQRIRPEAPGKGRYLRVSYLSRTSTTTYLDEVLVWGEGEVSDAYPENIRPIPRGDALRMAGATNGVVEWIPLQDPAKGPLQPQTAYPECYKRDTEGQCRDGIRNVLLPATVLF